MDEQSTRPLTELSVEFYDDEGIIEEVQIEIPPETRFVSVDAWPMRQPGERVISGVTLLRNRKLVGGVE